MAIPIVWPCIMPWDLPSLALWLLQLSIVSYQQLTACATSLPLRDNCKPAYDSKSIRLRSIAQYRICTAFTDSGAQIDSPQEPTGMISI